MRSTAPLNEDRRRRVVVSAQCDLTPDPQAIALPGRPVSAAVDVPSFSRSASLRCSPVVRAVPRRVQTSPPQPPPSLLLKRPPPMWIRPSRSQPQSARSSRSCCRPIPVQGGAGCLPRSTTPVSSLSAPVSAMNQICYNRPRSQRQRRPEFGREISRRVQQRKRHFRQSYRSSRSFRSRVAPLAPQQSR